MIIVEMETGRWDGLRLQLPVNEAPRNLFVTDDGHVILDDRDIGDVKEYEEK